MPLEPRDGVPDLMTDPAELSRFSREIEAGSGPVAIDAERASGYRYGQRAYLIQVRRQGAGTALIDPIALPDLSQLQAAMGDAEWILHAATQDLPCLADVGLRPTRLFDTELAGRLLNRERVGLAALVLEELGEVIEKGHGAADWSLRPLSPAQLRYAALDVEVLIELREAMDAHLRKAGKRDLARQEFDALLSFEARPRTDEDWRRTSGLHKVRKPRALAIVRELWRTRDDIARERDVAVGRLLPDSSIIVAAVSHVSSVDELRDLPDFHGRGAARYLGRWWGAITRARALPEDQCPRSGPRQDGPPPARSWADRDPQAHARLLAARAGLAEVALQMDLPVENLISPDIVRRLCWQPPDPAEPHTVADRLRDSGARAWQVDACAGPLAAACTASVDVAAEVTDE